MLSLPVLKQSHESLVHQLVPCSKSEGSCSHHSCARDTPRDRGCSPPSPTVMGRASLSQDDDAGPGSPLLTVLDDHFILPTSRGSSANLLPPNEDGSGFTVIDGVGGGGYASVLLSCHVSTKRIFAMKFIPKRRVSKVRDRYRLQRELFVLTGLPKSPFLLSASAAFESKTALFIVTDFLPGGDLFFHLSQRLKQGKHGFSEDEARVLLAEVVLGLEHMHGYGFVHRDVKAENVCLDSAGHVKLIDMGLAKELPKPQVLHGFQSVPLSLTGSLIYMPPELLLHHTGGRHTDWWAVGVLAHELLTGRTPWSSNNDKKQIRREIKTLQVEPPPHLSPPAGQLLCSLLQRDPTRRLGTCQKVRSSSFFESLDWSLAERRELPPPFVRPSDCFHAQDRRRSIDAYMTQLRHHDEAAATAAVASGRTIAPEAGVASETTGDNLQEMEWVLGLDFVTEHPMYAGKVQKSQLPALEQPLELKVCS